MNMTEKRLALPKLEIPARILAPVLGVSEPWVYSAKYPDDLRSKVTPELLKLALMANEIYKQRRLDDVKEIRRLLGM